MGAMGNERESLKQSGAIPPEMEILLRCACTRSDPAARVRFRQLLQNPLDWERVVNNASRQRMSAPLYECIHAEAPDLVPEQQLQPLRDAVRASAASAMILVGELLRLMPQFEAAKISAIPYKGPVLATLAYGSFARREYSDLDIALPQRSMPAAAALLQSEGYRPQFDLRQVHAGANGFAPGQYAFLSPRLDVLVELHTERTLRYYPAPVDFQEMTGRLIRVEIAGQSLRTFSVEDSLVMLCVHGAKHFWERLFWILDIAQLVAVQPVDWTLLFAIAAKMECTRILLLGLYLAHDLFAVPLPDMVMRQALGDPQVRRLAGQVREQYAGVSDPGKGVLRRARFRLRSRDKFWPGLRHLLRLGMSPTESDLNTVRLPRLFSPLYALVRPWRLLGEYGLGGKRRAGNAPREKMDKGNTTRNGD